jgi:predicted protein tyrosine phosphatase
MSYNNKETESTKLSSIVLANQKSMNKMRENLSSQSEISGNKDIKYSNRLNGKKNNMLITNVLKPTPPGIPLPENINDRQKQLIKNGWPIQAFDFPVEIFPNLWLSGIGFDDDLPGWCGRNGFTHIVNAAGKYGRDTYYKTHPYSYNIKYLELDIDDIPQFSLEPFLSQMYTFVYNAYNQNNKILIHCIWGQSRSVSCLVYFAMIYWSIKYDVAINLVKRYRPSACPNNGFELQLRFIDLSRTTKLLSKESLETKKDKLAIEDSERFLSKQNKIRYK